MTCVVGLRTPRGVLLAADSEGANSRDRRTRRDSKLISLSESVAVGYTSSFRMGQLLRFHLPKEATTASTDRDPFEWAVTVFVPAARKLFADHGFGGVKNSREEVGGVFLLAVRHRLFTVFGDFQVAEYEVPYAAIGSGGDYAMGAMHALVGELEPLVVADAALRAAAQFAVGVGGPFAFLEVEC